MEHNANIAEALRNQTGKLLDTIVGIEGKTSEVAEAFDITLCNFTQEKVGLEFSTMSVFSDADLLKPEAEAILMFRVDGLDDQIIACFRIHHDAARALLAATLGGAGVSEKELGEGKLSASEERLFTLLVDDFMSDFFECVDINTDFGIPHKPFLAAKEETFEMVQNREFVSFVFEISMPSNCKSIEMIVPFDVFEIEVSDKAANREAEIAKEQELIWSQKLYQRVEDVELPHRIEIANCELSLESLASVNLGTKLDIKVETENIRILDASGCLSFMGNINISENGTKLQVADVHTCEGI